MSLAMPAAPESGDDPGPSGEDDFICSTSETLVAAIEKCLDNGIGSCLVVEAGQRFVGQISLEELGKAVLDGVLLAPTLGQYMEKFAYRRPNAANADNEVL